MFCHFQMTKNTRCDKNKIVALRNFFCKWEKNIWDYFFLFILCVFNILSIVFVFVCFSIPSCVWQTLFSSLSRFPFSGFPRSHLCHLFCFPCYLFLLYILLFCFFSLSISRRSVFNREGGGGDIKSIFNPKTHYSPYKYVNI